MMRKYTWKNTLPAWLALLYAVVARWADWEPARTVVQLHTDWFGGYRDQAVMFSTWALLLIPILASVALILWVDFVLHPSSERPPADSVGRACAVQYFAPRQFGLAIAAVLTAFAGAALVLTFVEPSVIAPVLELVLLVAPWLVLFAGAHLLDAALPSRWREGTIDRLQIRPGQLSSSLQFLVHSGEREWRVDELTFLRLQVGQPMWVRHSVMWGYLREFRMYVGGYR